MSQSLSDDWPRTAEKFAESITRIEADVASLKSDMDQIIQSLVVSLKRDRSFDELQEQLRRSERVAQAWKDAPLLTGIHDAVVMLRQTDGADKHLVAHLENLIYEAGVEEYGAVDDTVDPEEVSVTEVTGSGPNLTVSACKRPGLRIGGLPLRKPIVEVTRSERTNQ
ncbi:hypothetical protein [Brevibacterium aurantiacum]|uniref:Nucleotide exchange factor GrpE n=1 Tax=Brevibacterium aurantiacum TaxID=273384 RepID=A0A2A3Z003_BREAU|nr:hypothetical protein [Brevibacterium aurantiacum]PCC44886.1 hypothetical protein CIK64_18600 [Brevibacterium aurantiacum]